MMQELSRVTNEFFYDPWVGPDWRETSRPLLLLGETPLLNHKTRVLTSSDSLNLKPLIIESVRSNRKLGRSFRLKHLQRLYQSLFGTISIDTAWFWDHIALSSIDQDHIQSIVQMRPTVDFLKGWNLNMALMSYLKPSQCLVLGTKSQNKFFKALELQGWDVVKDEVYKEKVSSCLPRVVLIQNKTGERVKVFFIGKLSNSFNHILWNEFLKDKLVLDDLYKPLVE